MWLNGLEYEALGTVNARVRNFRASLLPQGSSLTIPASVMIGGVARNVTEIGPAVFANPRKGEVDWRGSQKHPEINWWDSGWILPSRITQINFPSTLQVIHNEAFFECEHIRQFNMSSCRTIGERAFEGCRGLKFFSASHNLLEIRAWAFHRCRLESVTLNEGLDFIGDRVFDSVTSHGDTDDGKTNILSEIMIPSTVMHLGAFCFFGQPLEVIDGITGWSNFFIRMQSNMPSSFHEMWNWANLPFVDDDDQGPIDYSRVIRYTVVH